MKHSTVFQAISFSWICRLTQILHISLWIKNIRKWVLWQHLQSHSSGLEVAAAGFYSPSKVSFESEADDWHRANFCGLLSSKGILQPIRLCAFSLPQQRLPVHLWPPRRFLQPYWHAHGHDRCWLCSHYDWRRQRADPAWADAAGPASCFTSPSGPKVLQNPTAHFGAWGYLNFCSQCHMEAICQFLTSRGKLLLEQTRAQILPEIWCQSSSSTHRDAFPPFALMLCSYKTISLTPLWD